MYYPPDDIPEVLIVICLAFLTGFFLISFFMQRNVFGDENDLVTCKFGDKITCEPTEGNAIIFDNEDITILEIEDFYNNKEVVEFVVGKDRENEQEVTLTTDNETFQKFLDQFEINSLPTKPK